MGRARPFRRRLPDTDPAQLRRSVAILTKSRSTSAGPGSGRDERSKSSVSMIWLSACSMAAGPSARACAAMRARFGPKTGGRARASAASGPSAAQAAA